MNRSTSIRRGLAVVVAAAVVAGASGPAVWAKPALRGPTEAQKLALAHGFQVAPKGTVSAKKAATANPYLSTLPDATKIDHSAWVKRMAVKADQRVASASSLTAKTKAAGKALKTPLIHDEEEPQGLNGSNDTPASAEPIAGFGTRAKANPRLRILGDVADLTPEATVLARVPEDNGQLDKAGDTKIKGQGAVRTTGVIGDGPHGSAGDGTNDFDFFKLTATAGLTIAVDTSGSPFDTIAVVYDSTGEIVATDDDSGSTPYSSLARYLVPKTGVYYALVAGYSELGPLPEDPTDSGSGAGEGEEGTYSALISSGPVDTDVYTVTLAKGDVLGATLSGKADSLTVYRPNGTQMVRAVGVDASGIYPASSPLPGGGNTTLAYVAEASGRYAVAVAGAPGRYDALLEAYRPGSETDTSTRVQTVFLDFDGERLNTGIFGGAGVRTLSPFSAFIAKWGLDRTQEATLVSRITAVVTENIRKDLAAKGLNSKLSVRVINSRTSADPFGKANVSRVVVGGTIDQSGVPTIGIAQSIDPGNYAHEETALVLLDVLSDADRTNPASLNSYLTSRSDRVAFVSRAIGNVISHEIGHYIGSFHTDNSDTTRSVMDAGGVNFGLNLYGVGKDKIGGTADDDDIDFSTDVYAPQEGFAGKQNTLNVSAWAFVRGPRVPSA